MLHNKYDRLSLEKRLQESNVPRTTLSFYKYITIEDTAQFRNELYKNWDKLGVLGRIYVAKEGINAQISLPTSNLEAFREYMYALPGFFGMRLNYAVEDDPMSFIKLTIKIREKILADGLDDSTFNPANSGIHLNAKAFNEITEGDNYVLIDMRNFYESEVGHFKGAITPPVETFKESLPIIKEILEEHKDKDIVMYCTGGIRCEKASAWIRHQGIPNVYQLNGGIIEYSRQCRELDVPNKFLGKNFVFDERLGERISPDIVSNCHQCENPSDDHNNCKNVGCNLLFIQCKSCSDKFEGCCSESCKTENALPEEVKQERRQGRKAPKRYYHKGNGGLIRN
jgi:UPF0176 protein